VQTFISDGICSAFTSILSYRQTGASKNPRTAQLTIFYAGMVNVYDDVPFDKVSCCFGFNFISVILSYELRAATQSPSNSPAKT
jgi:hypothetical protein